MSSSSDGDALAWAQLLLSVLDEGRRTATYKYAVLLAIVDCCLLNSDADGRPPQTIPVRDLARRVLELYWPQVRPYPRQNGTVLLSQSTQPTAVTADTVRALQQQGVVAKARTPAAVEKALPAAYAAALDVIELNLVRMPLGRLQRPATYSKGGASDYPRFLYDDSTFHEGLTLPKIKKQPLSVVLQPQVADWIVSLSGLIRPLVEMHWVRAVAVLSDEDPSEERLHHFLFGSERISLQALRPGLLDAQQGRCFYCDGALSPGGIQVDHFVPWSRVPNDALGNLVLADVRCNNSKRDHFADLTLLERWAHRPEDVLHQVADEVSWPLRLAQSKQAALSLYLHLPAGTQLWQAPGVFTLLDPGRLREITPTLT